MEEKMIKLTAVEAVAAMKSGQVPVERYAAALIAQAQSLKSLGTIISMDPEQILADARRADKLRAAGGALGPLFGLPVLLKDGINTAALPTTAGTRALARNRPKANAPVAQALFDAGAILFGKANMHELAFGVTSNNAFTGPVRNPYNPALIAGGSSGGNGAAVAARICPAGLGEDTGGSVRIPAALCGIAGLRPSIGRYPGTGASGPEAATFDLVPLSSTRDTAGPMARTVADAALLDCVIAGDSAPPDPANLKGVRLGIASYFFAGLDSQVEAVIGKALKELTHLGAVLVEADVPDVGALNAAAFPIVFYEAPIVLAGYLRANNTGVTLDELLDQVASPNVKSVLESILPGGASAVARSAYQAALATRSKLQANYADYFADNNVAALVFPTTILPARPIGQDTTVDLNGAQVNIFLTYIRNTDPGSVAGIPGLSLPSGLTSDGLPVGLELDGPAGSDRALLAIGLAIERALGSLPPPR